MLLQAQRRLSDPLHPLPLLLCPVKLPLLLHELQELLAVDQELAALLLLPDIDLGLQLLLQLQGTNGSGGLKSTGSARPAAGDGYLNGLHLGQVLLQVGSLLFLLEKVSSSVGEPRGICRFFLEWVIDTESVALRSNNRTERDTEARRGVSFAAALLTSSSSNSTQFSCHCSTPSYSSWCSSKCRLSLWSSSSCSCSSSSLNSSAHTENHETR